MTLAERMPRVDEEIPCGWMGHEDSNRLLAARANMQKIIATLPKKVGAK